MLFQEPQISKSKVEIPSFELTSTDFEPRDLILEVDEDIPTDDISISSQTGNKTGGDYPQELKCSRCDVTVQSKERVKRHEEISKGVQTIQTCNECSFISCTSSELTSKSHGARENKNSNKCDKQFSCIKNFERHVATKDELTNCALCDFKSCTKIGMATHMKFHTLTMKRVKPSVGEDMVHDIVDNVSSIDEKCPKNTNNNLKRPHQCGKCNRSFSNQANLELHLKTKDELTMCESCNFKSCTKLGFSHHMKKVHGLNQSGFECPKCDQKFHSSVLLRSHEKTKQDEHICEDCGFKSCTYLGFLSHLRKTHGKKSEKSILKEYTNFAKPRIYNCIKCDQKFYSKENLEFHVKKIRDDVLSCSKCDFKSCTKIGLSIHFRKVHDISSDAVENVPDGAMILDVLEQKQSIPMTSHGRFMVS